MSAIKTRELWLELATNKLRPFYRAMGHEIPLAVRVSVGFPGGGSARKRIGEHWHPKSTSDGVSQIFISPVLEKSIDALSTLTHELIHSVYPSDGHKGGFAKAVKALGMTKPYKASGITQGSALETLCLNIVRDIGEYPHAAINLADRKKQTTRMLKGECESCGYVVRVSAKWIEDAGYPICPTCNKSMKGNNEL